MSYSGMCALPGRICAPRGMPSACLGSGSFKFSQMTTCSGMISLATYPTSQSELDVPQRTRRMHLLLSLVIVSSCSLTLNSVTTGTMFFISVFGTR